jgi:transcriptional regulator with XRE-family HTH domain
MANFNARRPAGTDILAGRKRSLYLANRLGTGLREARAAAGLTQSRLAGATRVSQPEISRLERDQGSNASLETWASVASACGAQLVAFLEDVPGAARPRDYEHLKRQQLVVRLAARGGWRVDVERRIGPTGGLRGYIDVRLDRPKQREIAIVEIWDWFDDAGAAFRAFDSKTALTAREGAAGELRGAPAWRVNGVLVVRGTRRNRALLREFGQLFRSRFPGSGRAWLAAFGSEHLPMPEEPALL